MRKAAPAGGRSRNVTVPARPGRSRSPTRRACCSRGVPVGEHPDRPFLWPSSFAPSAALHLDQCVLSIRQQSRGMSVRRNRASESSAQRAATTRVVIALTDLLTSANIAPLRRQGVAEPASLRPADDDRPTGDGRDDKKLDRRSGGSTGPLTESSRSATSSPGSSRRSVRRCQACSAQDPVLTASRRTTSRGPSSTTCGRHRYLRRGYGQTSLFGELTGAAAGTGLS
jgi:hypothetical protein